MVPLNYEILRYSAWPENMQFYINMYLNFLNHINAIRIIVTLFCPWSIFIWSECFSNHLVLDANAASHHGREKSSRGDLRTHESSSIVTYKAISKMFVLWICFMWSQDDPVELLYLHIFGNDFAWNGTLNFE